jgi:hypothetical protein
MEEKANILNIYQTRIWLDIHIGKLFDQYYIKDGLEVERDSLLEKAFDHKKAIAHE